MSMQTIDNVIHVERNKQRAACKIALALAPPAIVVAGLAGASFFIALFQSFGYAPIYDVHEFPTLRFYRTILSNKDIWQSLLYTLYYAFVSTILGIICSVTLALTLRKRFFGKKIFEYTYKFPLMVPYIVVVSLCIVIFNKGGMLSRLMYSLGLIKDIAQFPNIIYSKSGIGIILVFLWKQIPFMTLSLLAVLSGMGQDSEEVARTLGAKKSKIFFAILLPQILPAIVSSSLICLTYNLVAFEVPFILGAGYPETLSITAWRFFNETNYQQRPFAMVVIVMLIFVSSIIVYSYLHVYRVFERKFGRV